MNTLYCNIGGSLKDTLHLDTLPTVGAANHEARSAEDVRRIIAHTGVTYAMFAAASLPRNAVAVDHPKLYSYIRRMLAPASPPRTQARAAQVAVADANIDDIIDN
jgi:hypothetical protein